MAVDLRAVSEQLFEGVMAPLVLGGALRPPHAVGAQVALALGPAERLPADIDLASRVQRARVRRARRLVPVDRFGPPTAEEWALAAMFSDVLQAANPAFDAALRRGGASRILSAGVAGLARILPPASAKDALSRHTWFARILDVARTDTTVSWWAGSGRYLGVDPPARVQAWPSLRRVQVSARPVPLLDLEPLAFERERLVHAVARFLERTPLTDLATCARAEPAFAWSPAALALVATGAGRTLALRAIDRLPPLEADAALGRASRELLRKLTAPRGSAAAEPVRSLRTEALAVASLHADRVLAVAEAGEIVPSAVSSEDAAFALGLGAAAAQPILAAGLGAWSAERRGALLASLETAASSPQGLQATALLGAAGLPADSALAESGRAP